MTAMQLTFDDVQSPGPKVAPDDYKLDMLVSWLDGRGWQTAADLRERFGWSDRTCRALAAASGGLVISGQKGYALLTGCTPEEINHAASWLESQAKQMLTRAIEIRRLYHAHGRQEASR